jgi:hypothetical protein
MGDMLLNGRVAADFELAAIGHGRRCELERDLVLLAGVLAEEVERPAGRPVTDLILELGR